MFTGDAAPQQYRPVNSFCLLGLDLILFSICIVVKILLDSMQSINSWKQSHFPFAIQVDIKSAGDQNKREKSGFVVVFCIMTLDITILQSFTEYFILANKLRV
jgi:hypothetical protein